MKINKSLLSLIPLTAVAVTTITSVFAWYVSTIGITQDLSDGKLAANASYFESGDGSKDSPFIISNARHLYNLAWLQDLGHFDDKVYYFELKNDIDMSQLKVGSNSASPIPAIGIDDHPFIGSFNGNGHTINNLFVATSFSSDTCIKPSQDVLNSHNQEQTKETYNTTTNTIISSYNGLFGVIKKYKDSSDSDSQVTNFTIANAKIESSQNTLVGYICGYVNSDLSHVGVASSNLTIGEGVTHITTTSTTYPISKYGIVGDYNNASGGIQWEQSGGDIGYGTSTDITALHNSLIKNKLNDGDTGKIKSKYVLPFKYDNDTPIKGSGDQITVTTSGSRTQKINPSEYYTYKASTKGNNLGYYIGEVKTYEMSLDYNKDDFGVQSGSGYNVTNANLKTPPDDVLTYLKNNGTHLIRLNNGYSSDNIANSTFSYVQNGQVGNWTGNLILPSNGIWVAPKENGTFKFVFYNANYGKSGNAGSVGILFTELTRVTPGDYSSAFVYNSLICSGISYSCKYGYFEKTATAGKEYYITFYNSSSYDAPYIAYMDIGTNGTDTPTYIGTIKDIDYTYYTDSNKTGYALVNTDNDFKLSGVYFNIDSTTTKEVALYVMRSIQSGNLVYYYFVSDGGLTNTVTGSPTKKDSLDDWKSQE